MLLGVIADDFTGATDIASFLVENGISTIQLNGVPDDSVTADASAVVISLKSRSCPAEEAIADSLAALRWLQQRQCQQIYFKYCSTFDSTPQGNIGPVTDALMEALGTTFTIFSPALPVNGRTVYQGYLFVLNQLLAESGMRNHPVNPMTDSYLPRLVEAQSTGRCGVIASQVLDRGADAVREAIAQLQEQGFRYAVLDALSERHLEVQGEALRDMALVTGGSGLAIGLARQHAPQGKESEPATRAGYPSSGRAVVLSGSCSLMTNRQVAHYRQQAPAQSIDVARCLESESRSQYADELAQWVLQQPTAQLAPLLYATADAGSLAAIQRQWGAQQASHAVEQLFAAITTRLAGAGITRFIVAGGETSGVVAQSLGIHGFHIGPCISPGVPWVKAIASDVSLALKSGNFGDEAFFSRAQTEFPA
ncbi:3-oxo-tetronate kinase [Entomohabitans teleogrylli]|uniref:3-oxo-tetronate kinase n=1 Tax=Entomohabitans teleogrylli TaxID=1384589 RepID=UPI00073D45AD|nr:3-oxo-tetronate kinase [Entomohabitans teleogrylli]